MSTPDDGPEPDEEEALAQDAPVAADGVGDPRVVVVEHGSGRGRSDAGQKAAAAAMRRFSEEAAARVLRSAGPSEQMARQWQTAAEKVGALKTSISSEMLGARVRDQLLGAVPMDYTAQTRRLLFGDGGSPADLIGRTLTGTASSAGGVFEQYATHYLSTAFSAFSDRIDTLTAGIDFQAIGRQIEGSFSRIWTLLPSPEKLQRANLPENLRPETVPYDPARFEALMAEGIPLAYVLDEAIVQALAATSTPQERRALLSRHRERILRDCASLLDQVSATEVLPFVRTAKLAIDGLRDGHVELAQTWAAANLETLVKQFDEQRWSAILDVKQPPPKLFRSFFFVAQLRAVMAKIGRGPVPGTFNRQGSVHFTTTRKQFSKLNAMLAIAHLTSAICNYDAAAKQVAPRHR